MRMKMFSHFISTTLVFLLVVSVSSLPLSQSRHLHTMRRRSHPASKPPLNMKENPFFDEEQRPLTVQEELAILERQPLLLPTILEEEGTPLYMEESSFVEEESPDQLRHELLNHGFTKVIVDEEGTDGILHIKEILLEENSEENDETVNENDEENLEKVPSKRKKVGADGVRHLSTKKFNHPKKGRRKPHSPKSETTVLPEEDEDATTTPLSELEVTTETSSFFHKFTGGKNPPLILPVTTEGKSTLPKGDPVKVYGFPKELLPIMPGGGSRFEDVEREKLEKEKMSQIKGNDDDSAENGGSHEAESLYSSASLTSMSLAFYCLVSFLHLGTLSL